MPITSMRRYIAHRARVRCVSAGLAAAFVCVAGCSNEKPASQLATGTPGSATAAPTTSTAQHAVPQENNSHTRASSPPIFLIIARTSSGDLVSGTCFYLSRPNGRWIITANHVIDEAEPDSIVARIGNVSVRLRIASQDRASDLAALLPSQAIPNTPLTLRSTRAHRGELVSLTGFPIPDVMGGSSPTTVQGPVTDDAATVGGKPDFK
jgi:S1-C subfamily serine protease